MAENIWIHNIDPFLIHISGNVGVRWYGLAYVTGFVCAFLFMKWFSQKKITPMTVDQASDFITYLIAGVLFGGRLGYALFYSPELLTDFRGGFPFWGVFAVWEGGMASHGGIVGVLVACMIFSWRHKIPFPHLGDLTIFGAAIGIFFGRIANFINGELMGKVASPDLPWAVKFPQDVYRWIGYSPEKLFSLKPVADAMNIPSEKWTQWTDNIQQNRGSFYAFTDQMIEHIRSGHLEVVNALRPLLEPRHPSQLYAACTEGLIPLVILFFIWKKARKPGLIGSLFWIMYAIGRIFNENFRLPDAHIADLTQQPLGISRGQFLSLFILAVGILFLVWTQKKKDVELLGGWGQKK